MRRSRGSISGLPAVRLAAIASLTCLIVSLLIGLDNNLSRQQLACLICVAACDSMLNTRCTCWNPLTFCTHCSVMQQVRKTQRL